MILCNFCQTKTQASYLFLVCRHLSCLRCAYQRTDFSSQEIQCCNQFTKIDVDAMEKIIKSKRIFKNVNENKQNKYNYVVNQSRSKFNYSISNSKVGNPESHKQISFKQRQLQPLMQKQQFNIKQATFNQQHQQKGKLALDQNQVCELQNILLRQIERVKKFFESERQILKERQEIALKDLSSTYQKEVKQTKRPISSPEIQKINLNLSKKVSQLNTKNITSQESRLMVSIQNSKDLKDSRQSYDHILKRLQTNQQRMKQKIQRHLQTPF